MNKWLVAIILVAVGAGLIVFATGSSAMPRTTTLTKTLQRIESCFKFNFSKSSMPLSGVKLKNLRT